MYWRRLTTVERAGGYYGTAFQGERGVTQGDLLSTTIFNVVVDAVVRHWVTVMAKGAEDRGESGQEVRHQDALFYAENGMVASSDPHWIQGDFNNLVGLFDMVGLWTNIRKKVGMVCHPCQAAGNQSEAAYGRWITGEGTTYQECQKGRVQCRECGEEMAAISVEVYRMTQYGQAVEARWSWKNWPRGKSRRRIAWPSRPKEARGYAWWRDTHDERRQGRRCRSIYYTGM